MDSVEKRLLALEERVKVLEENDKVFNTNIANLAEIIIEHITNLDSDRDIVIGELHSAADDLFESIKERGSVQ